MKPIFTLVIFSFWMSSAFGQTARRSCFTSPAAGDIITCGQTVNLKWPANSDVSGHVKISFWNQKAGDWEYVGSSEYQSGSFLWNAPMIYGKSFRLRGIADNGDVMYSSGFFSILPPAAKVEAAVPGVTSAIDMTVHPNPASLTTRICVADLPADIPANVEVVNEDGTTVATLYNATPDAELGLCLTLDCSKLPSGTYFAHIQNSIMGRAVKLSIQH